MNSFRRVLLGLAVGALALPVWAQTVVVPNANTAVEGAHGLSTMVRSQPRTLQMIIGASELSTIPLGSTITGVSFRLDDLVVPQPSQPLFTATFANYDIYVGAAANTPLGADNTFANNYVLGTRQQLRSGSLTLTPGYFPNSGAAPNSFAAAIGFNLGSYTYNGGPLVVEITHDGNGSTDFALDAVANGSGAAAYAATGYNATTNQNINSVVVGPSTIILMPVLSLSYISSAAPEPGVLGLLLLGGLVLVGRRRR